MSHAPRTSPTSHWNLLQNSLAGSFRARARNLLGTEFSLLGPDEREFARLRMRGYAGAEIRAGTSVTTIESSSSHYQMTTGGAVVLLAEPREPRPEPQPGLRISSGAIVYEASYNLLRNTATALPETPDTSAEVSLEGGFTGRSYRAEFPRGDGGALAVAVFLLYRNASLRRQAFQGLKGGP